MREDRMLLFLPRIRIHASLRRVALAIDGNPGPETVAALTRAAALLGTEVVVLMPVERDVRWHGSLDRELADHATSIVEAFLEQLGAAGLTCRASIELTAVGESARAIEKAVEREEADLVLVPQRRGWRGWFRTGLAHALVARGREPVLVIPVRKQRRLRGLAWSTQEPHLHYGGGAR